MPEDRSHTDTARILLAGDVMTGRGIDQIMPRPCRPDLYEPVVRDARDYVRMAVQANGPIPSPAPMDYVWGEALAEMDRMNPCARIVNLETAVTEDGRPWRGKVIHYRMHPAHVGCLAAARITACSLANNHVLDWGFAGLEQTLLVLRHAGIATAGAGANSKAAGEPAALPLPDGGRLLLFARAECGSGAGLDWAATGSSPGISLLPGLTASDADALGQKVERHRRPGDLVAVSLHWGGNWVESVPAGHRAFARRLIDLGIADIVHGHSSHHPLATEIHRGKLILYGCGDLINDYEGIESRGNLRSDVGCLYAADVDRSNGALRNFEVIAFQMRNFRLSPAHADALAWLAGIFEVGHREFGTRLERRSGNRWVLV